MILPRRLRVASLLLVFLLIAGPLVAAPHRPYEAWQSRFSISEPMAEAWAFVSRIWKQAGNSTAPFGKAGSQTDPFGNPTPTSQSGDSTTSTAPSTGK
jgi:hypothetical protein